MMKKVKSSIEEVMSKIIEKKTITMTNNTITNKTNEIIGDRKIKEYETKRKK